MKRCPYCLNEINEVLQGRGAASVYLCKSKECGVEIHRDFVEAKNLPRISVGMVGFSGHGKTVFITSLFYLLKHMCGIWDNYYYLTMDDYTLKVISTHVPMFEEDSKLPDSTPENFPSPALIRFHKVPGFGDSFLSIYDTAGEVFESPEKISDHGRFVAYSEFVLFNISIDDCGRNWPDRLHKLLDTYVQAVYGRLRVELKKKQHLIVVLTKADALLQTDKAKMFSETLCHYINNGSFKSYTTLERDLNLRRLRRTSMAVREWLKEKKCGGFIAAAQDNFKSVEYTVVSSTGAAPIGNMLATKLNPEDPKRVLDPFLWIQEKIHNKSFFARLFRG